MSNTAKRICIPTQKGMLRAIFLFVGQGDSTLLAVPDGEKYRLVLIDCNRHPEVNGIDVAKLLNDLCSDPLDLFINTHPHKDHLGGIKEIHKTVKVAKIWHSGHEPKGKHKDAYKELKDAMKDIGDENVSELRGTRETLTLWDISYNCLAPADYVKDDIEDEDADKHYQRIHEHCAVLRFIHGKAPKRLLITGDADYVAWKEHITEYHAERLESCVLSAAHHGSRTFFMENEGDDPYEDHIKKISPDYLAISAPSRKESDFDHPHKDAIKIYEKHVDKDSIINLGDNKECVIVDIDAAGNIDVYTDKELVEKYGLDGDGGGGKAKKASTVTIVSTKIDNKPMGDLNL
jgi:beta-lactamase superfamily II metal-dependent hydrolase